MSDFTTQSLSALEKISKQKISQSIRLNVTLRGGSVIIEAVIWQIGPQ